MISEQSLPRVVPAPRSREELLVNKLAAGIESSIAAAVLDRYDLLQETEHLKRRISEEKARLARG